MAKLTNLQLAEFSIVHGDDTRPANPGATALVFKAAQKIEDPMQKSIPAEQPKTLAEKIGAAIRTAVGKGTEKAVATRTSTSESTSKYVEQYDDGQQMIVTENPDGSVAVTVNQSEGAPVPVAPVAQSTATAAVVSEDVITQAVQAAIAPLQQSIATFDSRLATIENTPVGSGQIAKSTIFNSTQSTGASKFPEFSKMLFEAAGLTPGQRLTKAAITSASFSYGLHVEEANAFIDYIINESVLLKQVRNVKVMGKTAQIAKIGLGSKVLRKGTAGTDPGDTVSITTSQIDLTCPEVVGIVRISDDALEDNIEGDALVQHLLTMIGAAAANELEVAAIHADTAVADAAGINDRWDGWLKKSLAGGQVVDATGDTDRFWPGTQGGKGDRMIMSLPTKYRNYQNMRWLLHPDVYLNYNQALAALGISEAYASVTGIKDAPLRSIANLQVPAIRTDLTVGAGSDGTIVMLTDLRNLIFAVSRDIRIESQRVPRARSTDYVISMRATVEIENLAAVAVYNKAKVKAPVA